MPNRLHALVWTSRRNSRSRAVPPAQPASPPGPPKIAVLIVTGQHGHNWRGTTPLLRKILEDTGKFEVRVTEEFRGAGPDTLAPYDLVVLNYYDKKQPALRWGERAETALLNFVRSGKGLVIYHFSMAAFEGWSEFETMSGANWRPNSGHHSARHDFTVTLNDVDDPIVCGGLSPWMFDQLKRATSRVKTLGSGRRHAASLALGFRRRGALCIRTRGASTASGARRAGRCSRRR